MPHKARKTTFLKVGEGGDAPWSPGPPRGRCAAGTLRPGGGGDPRRGECPAPRRRAPGAPEELPRSRRAGVGVLGIGAA